MPFEFFIWDSNRDGDLVPEFVLALNTVFPSDKIDQDRFIWKHVKNPCGQSIIAYARCLDTGNIAGIRAFMSSRLHFKGNIYLAFQPCDTATLPSYLRQGLFSRLTRMAISHAQNMGGHLLFNFPNKFSKNGYLKLGWEYLGQLNIYVRPVSAGIIRRVFSGTSSVERNNYDNTVLPDLMIGNMSEYFIKKITSSEDHKYVHGFRDLEHLKWRMSKPCNTYQYVSTEDAACLIRLGTYHRLKEACIVDVIFKKTPEINSFTMLLRQIIRQIKPAMITAVLTKDHPLNKYYRKSYFISVPNHSNFTVYPISDTFSQTDLLKWALSAYDIDTY